MTKRGLLVGTPEYMAPRAGGERADRHSDISRWGWCCTRCCVGLLFHGDSALTVAVKHITEAFAAAVAVRGGEPEDQAVCLRAQQGARRSTTAREMRTALRAAINLTPGARRRNRWSRTAATTAAPGR
jgi:hypothetical protein